VRWVQRTDWDGVRVGMEGAIARLIGGGLEKSREEIASAEKIAGPIARNAIDKSRQAAATGANQVGFAVDKAATEAKRLGNDSKVGASKVATSTKEQAVKTGEKAVELKDAAKDQASKIAISVEKQASHAGETAGEIRDVAKAQARGTAADANTQAQAAADSVRRSGGTINAARGVVRDAISSGIEKGKEALGKAQVAVGIAENKVGSNLPATGISAVEKALHERYEKPDGLNKSVEQALEERYRPIDARDNTVLRGV
jgi:altered-inheritance-of-mitochondria protein 5